MKMWIARDPNEDLFLHAREPFLEGEKRGWLSCGFIKLDNDEFPEVTFENSPMEVELVIKK